MVHTTYILHSTHLYVAECLSEVLRHVELLSLVLKVVYEEQFVVVLVELYELRYKLEVVRSERRSTVRRREEVLVQRVCKCDFPFLFGLRFNFCLLFGYRPVRMSYVNGPLPVKT